MAGGQAGPQVYVWAAIEGATLKLPRQCLGWLHSSMDFLFPTSVCGQHRRTTRQMEFQHYKHFCQGSIPSWLHPPTPRDIFSPTICDPANSPGCHKSRHCPLSPPRTACGMAAERNPALHHSYPRTLPLQPPQLLPTPGLLRLGSTPHQGPQDPGRLMRLGWMRRRGPPSCGGARCVGAAARGRSGQPPLGPSALGGGLEGPPKRHMHRRRLC